MQRVSSNLMNDDMQYWQRRRERDMASIETRMARQSRFESPRDDPLAAARAVRFDSSATRLERFEKNAAWAGDQYRLQEGYLRQVLEITQRVREIAVQGANGVYSRQDQKYMAQEVDELLGEMVSAANARGPDGTYLFSGDASRTPPFHSLEGSAPGAAGAAVTEVRYLGASGGPAAEVAEGSYVPLGEAGSDLFWAEQQTAAAGSDARDWRASGDAAIIVDGRRVEIKAGDNVHAVAARINDSGAAVKAGIDPSTFSLVLETTLPHPLRLEDAEGPTRVLAELGLLDPAARSPSSWAPGARVSGGSLFDVVIRLRDSLNGGDALETGGAALAGIDAGLDNLNRRVAQLGSRTERLGFAAARLNREIPDTRKLLSAESDVDVARAITDYKMMEYAHTASLGLAGRLFPKTLLDFLQ